VRIECFGQSQAQDGRSQTLNQDAFVIGHQPVPWAAVSDGAGNAQSTARRALGLLETWMRDVSLGQLLRDETWRRWARSLDSALLGGPEATLVAVSVVGDELIGVCAGDSRAYVVVLEGPLRCLAGAGPKRRLGSGESTPVVFRERLALRDVLLLVSDGAWAPLGLAGLERAVRAMGTRPFAETPGAVLDAAGRRGRGDDMTAVALRLI
jgi:serine/threonine protein phosphatase PrpC